MSIAVFLDRDGTLNEEVGYIRQVDDLQLISGAADAIFKLNEAGIMAILTTNQTGAARGYYDESHIHALNNRLTQLLRQGAGASLDAMFYCPHYPGGAVPQFAVTCDCRKPGIGMITQAQKQFPDIDLSQSYVIGDKATDVEMAQNAGCKSILLRTGYGEAVLNGTYQQLTVKPHLVCRDIGDAVHRILEVQKESASCTA